MDVTIAISICFGSVIGSFLGAKIAINIPNVILEKVFGVEMLMIALKMIWG